MSAKARLQAVQTALEQRGVHDVKFCLAKGVAKGCPNSEVMEKVADFLEAYLAGKGTRVTRVGEEDLSIA